MWIHGGGWRLQDQTACPDLVQHFAEHGYVMVSIDYRLAPETRHLGPRTALSGADSGLRAECETRQVCPFRFPCCLISGDTGEADI
ncbi:alpha/beta hydrolase [Rhodococcus opacus]|uniref:alpha/beta hydrolase n=1 Tax=Rhodococcus TaxID=1827 RepID=UPI001ED9737A